MKKFIVECKPDEVLAKLLGFKTNEIAHQSNKGEVCNYLMRSKVNIAMIDEDPWSASQPKLLKRFKLEKNQYDIKHLVLKEEEKNVIILQPRLEEWILRRCNASNLNPEDHFLPSDNKKLKDVINYSLIRFEALLKNLQDKQDDGLIYLIKLVKNIHQKK